MTSGLPARVSERVDTSSAMRKWRPYPAYKNSGVDWLGEIPAHWQVKRLKYASALSPDVLPEDTDPDYPLKYVDISSVDSNGTIIETQDLLFVHAPSRARRVVREKDTIISTVRTYLHAIAYIQDPPENLVVSTGFAVLRPGPEVFPKFLWRLAQSSQFVNAVVAHSEGVGYPAINPHRLSGLPVWVPPVPEQQAIAAFLDRETAKLDALIAKKERLIELLQEKRAALISHAVTKGLDPAVPMKDSGVEWLGEIPAHWQVRKVRDIAESLQTGPFGSQLHSEDYSPGGIPVVNPSNMKDGRITPDPQCAVDKQTWTRLQRHELRDGDIVFARRGEMGRCAMVTPAEQGWLCGTGSLRMRPKTGVSYPRFLNRVISTIGVRDWLLLESVGATMDNLNTHILSRIPVPAPSPAEQRAIAAFLDRETAKIDALIAKIREAIDRLKEYRAALISAAVTGKIDVREDAG